MCDVCPGSNAVEMVGVGGVFVFWVGERREERNEKKESEKRRATATTKERKSEGRMMRTEESWPKAFVVCCVGEEKRGRRATNV